MQPGQLNKVVTIQSKVSGTDAYGGLSYTWSEVATVWAAVWPLKGRELIASQASQSEVTVTFVIRYISGIDAGMRIVYDEKYYDIKSVIDPQEKHEQLQLLTGTGLNDG